MKINEKNKTVRVKFLNVLFLVFFAVVSMFSFPENVLAKVKIVFFCTDWNAKCREAKQVINRNIAKYPNKIEYKEFNIDLNSTPDKIRALGLNMPDKIPFIIMLDKNENILYQDVYSTSSSNDFESALNKNVK